MDELLLAVHTSARRDLTDLEQGFMLGDWQILPSQLALEKNDEVVRLEPKVMRVLVYLAHHAGETITRDDLLRDIWGRVVVQEETITRSISALRTSLGDDRREPRFIQTVQRTGYRLIAPVRSMSMSQVREIGLEHEKRIKETAGTKRRRIGFAVMALLCAVLALVAYEKWKGPTGASTDVSLAVLPFVPCARLPRADELAGGLTINIISRLAERRALKVFAHSSSEALAQVGLPPREVARRLGVNFILTGDLCGEQEDLAATAELLDAQGFVIWSGRFEQSLVAEDRVTVSLAAAVAGGVAARLGVEVPVVFEAPVMTHAYEQLLIAKAYAARGDESGAREAYQRALAIQPDLAEAAYEILLLDWADYHSANRKEEFEAVRPRLADALDTARQRLDQLEPTADTHATVARIERSLALVDEEIAFRWSAPGDVAKEEVENLENSFRAAYADAEHHMRAAIALNPSSTQNYGLLADVIERQGIARYAEALAVLEEGLERDPLNADYNWMVAKRWAARGRYRQAIELLDRFKALPEVPPVVWWGKLELMTLHYHYDEKAETLIDMLRNDPAAFDDWDNRWQAWWFVAQLVDLRLYEEAEAWKVRLERIPMAAWARTAGLNNYSAAVGQCPDDIDEDSPYDLARVGRTTEAIEILEVRRHSRAIWQERRTRDDLALANLYVQSGRESDAVPLLSEITRSLEAEYYAGIRHHETLYHLAEAYALQGRHEDAVAMLRKAVDYNLLVRCEQVLNDGWAMFPWRTYRQDQRFMMLCGRGDAELDLQAVRVSALLGEYDIDELLAPLMALMNDKQDYRSR